jgi:hypothetical protein
VIARRIGASREKQRFFQSAHDDRVCNYPVLRSVPWTLVIDNKCSLPRITAA